MKRTLLFLSLVVISAILFSGCSGIQKRESTGYLEPQILFKFSDIPTPAGFKLVEDDSYIFETSGLRVFFLKYAGRAEIDKVVSFYRDQMSMYDWHLLNVVEYGDRMLNFDRPKETCIVRIMPEGRNVIVTISVGPKTASSTSNKKATNNKKATK